ncbi:MAG: hypothetical protein JNK56_23115, partial [Myxococcales bacterium]|nr:hypothetical protein [Myxococcales bacterium]
MRRASLALAVLLVACRRDTPPPIAPTTPPGPPLCPPGSPPLQAIERSDPATAGASDLLGEPEQQRRLRGLAALDAGRFDLARAEFAAILAVAPGNLGVKALHDAATTAMLAAQDSAARSFANLRPTVLPAPPWRHTVVQPLTVPAGAPPRLVLVGKQTNGITDEAAWLQQHGLRLPEYEVPNPMRGQPGNLPPNLPPVFGNELLIQAIAHPDHTILVYGPNYSLGRHLAVLDA